MQPPSLPFPPLSPAFEQAISSQFHDLINSMCSGHIHTEQVFDSRLTCRAPCSYVNFVVCMAL